MLSRQSLYALSLKVQALVEFTAAFRPHSQCVPLAQETHSDADMLYLAPPSLESISLSLCENSEIVEVFTERFLFIQEMLRVADLRAQTLSVWLSLDAPAHWPAPLLSLSLRAWTLSLEAAAQQLRVSWLFLDSYRDAQRLLRTLFTQRTHADSLAAAQAQEDLGKAAIAKIYALLGPVWDTAHNTRIVLDCNALSLIDLPQLTSLSVEGLLHTAQTLQRYCEDSEQALREIEFAINSARESWENWLCERSAFENEREC